ncbi:MAG: apolipoprotein N-acyltransferase [Armatimonadetes bacterium]|nr:apolipoprotein N-acyltransferase [Armatimonadota bacterium]
MSTQTQTKLGGSGESLGPPVIEGTPGYGLWLPVLLAAAAGLVMFGAFPPLDAGALAWLALVVFFFALSQCRRPSWGFLTGLIYGVFFFGPLTLYISRFGFVPWALLTLVEALFFGLLGYLGAGLNVLPRPGTRAVGLASLWVLFEYLRAHRGSLSLTLGDVYYTQWAELSLLQLASLGGGHLVTFVMALLTAALATVAAAWLPLPLYRPPGMGPIFARDAARSLLLVYAVLFFGFFWGSWAYRAGQRAIAAADEKKGLLVGYAQAAVPTSGFGRSEDIPQAAEAYFRLTETLPHGLHLIVWPETAIPAVLDANPEYRERLQALAKRCKCYVLAGTNLQAPEGRLFNTLLLFDPQGRLTDQYAKTHLVLFGEYVPWRDRLPWLKRFPIRDFDYAPGEELKVMHAAGVRFAPLICFEALFPQLTRQVCRQGAELLVFCTSDVWAQGTYELSQHSRTAIVRAVEARRYVVRVATDGESMIVSPFGNRWGILPIGQPGIEAQTVHPIRALSVYHRLGDAPLLIFCCAAWLAAGWAAAASKKGQGQ